MVTSGISDRRDLAIGLAVTALAIGFATTGASAQSGGAVIYENLSNDMGSSYAGATARAAQDAGTAFSNPVGMTRLDENQLMIGLMVIDGELSFDLNAAGSITDPPGSTNGGGNATGLVPGLGTFGVLSLADNLKFGFSVTALAAAGVDYNTQWVGRSFITKNQLIVASLAPSVAYEVNDWLSLGVGLNIAYGSLDQELKATNAPDAPTIKIDDADDWGFGVTVGALFEFSERTRIGIAYRSQIDLKLSGDLQPPLPDPVP